jgi:hypothetical protein
VMSPPKSFSFSFSYSFSFSFLFILYLSLSPRPFLTKEKEKEKENEKENDFGGDITLSCTRSGQKRKLAVTEAMWAWPVWMSVS